MAISGIFTSLFASSLPSVSSISACPYHKYLLISFLPSPLSLPSTSWQTCQGHSQSADTLLFNGQTPEGTQNKKGNWLGVSLNQEGFKCTAAGGNSLFWLGCQNMEISVPVYSVSRYLASVPSILFSKSDLSQRFLDHHFNYWFKYCLQILE